MEEHNQILKESILEVVDNQLAANNPPETKQTFKRLITEGYSEKEAKEFIATVVVSEAFEVLQTQETFDKKRFVAALNELPEIPK